MSKLTLTEFREIKNSMLNLIELSEQRYSPENQDQSEVEKFLRKYNSLQDKLLSSDLSDIPFEEWQGLYIFTDGELDLSKTYANIDFSLLAGIKYDSINLQGCNIRGIQALDYDETTFDAKYMKAHPEYFPDESIPAEVRQLFYDKKLAFSDLIKYPALRKCVNEHSFSSAYHSSSHELVVAIGFENAIRLFDENPEFVNAITFEEDRKSFFNDNFNFRAEKPFDKSGTYEEAKQFVYRQIIDEIKHAYSRKLPSFDVLPQEMIDSFPNVFIKEGELPEKVVENYYNGNLSIREIRYYSEVLKTKDLEFGTHSSSEIRAVNKVFGDVWKFIEQVPQEYDNIVGSYLSHNAYEEEKIAQIAQQELPEIISDSIRYVLKDNAWSRSYYNLDELYAFSQYVPIEEIFEDASLRDFVQRCGFENIVEFNRKNNMILERTGESYSSITLLQEMVKYASVIGEDVLITDEQQLSTVFSQMIYQMRVSDDYSARQLLTKNKRELSILFPSEFLDYNMLDTLLKDMKEEDKTRLIECLESGFNGNTDLLFDILNKNPILLPVLANKSLIIGKNDWRLNEFYQQVGSEKFYDICSKYGKAVSQIISFIDYDEEKMTEFLSQISGENYERQMNQYIYDMLSKKSGRTFDLRTLPQSFKSEHPELFLDENAPKELQDVFYGKSYWGNNYTLLGAKDIQEHPEWIPFLMKVDLSRCLDNQDVSVYNSKGQDRNGYAYAQQMNLYEALGIKFSKEEVLDFISKYGHCINNSSVSIDVSLGKEEQYEHLITNIYNSIKNRQLFYNNKNMPREFIERYPDIFLDENVPEELQNLFYQREISPEIIQSHPEWKQFLQGKDIASVCDMNVSAFVRKCKQLGFDNNNVFELFDKYGSYIAGCQINIDSINSNNLGELDNIIRQQMIEAITVKRVKYDENARAIIGQEHPELFLEENAPDELKEVFYNYTSNTPLTFEFLKQHRDWLPYLEGKNILLSLKKRNMGIRGLEQLFEKYGEQEALRIGMKNPEAVMQMLSENKFDVLFDWYDKLHFVPHHVVMKEFPFEQADKFVASGKKWSQLMRIERHNINEDSKAALLKASMCFGVFDNDMDGFNKTMQLFSDIPKSLSTQDMQRMLDFIQKQILSLGDNPDPKMVEEYNKKLSLTQQCYAQNEDGTYSLKINSQQNKNIVQTLRSIMEDSNVSTILTADKAHKLFGAFIMKYDPDFRDFILKNMDTILSSDEYISYISSMQKQWSEIRAINSNLVLTLDLAMAYVKSNSYTDVQTGNTILAEKVSERGYNQQDFERLQQIYNYSKMRVFSTIPRVHFETEEYICEMIRLDDPMALVIGKLTDCCQELGNAAESCMTHSAVDKTGRIFYIRDKEGRPIAQSWVWRNQNVLCFDNIEIPEKAFTNATRKGISREQFTDTIYALYQRAGQELMEKDEVKFRKLLEEGKIPEEQYEALKLGKVTVGTGYNDIKESLGRNAVRDSSKLVEPLPYTSPIDQSHYLYDHDHLEGQYIVAGEQDVITSDYETPAIYSDEFLIHDNSNTKQKDVLMLQRLELVTKGDSYSGRTQTDETDKIVSDIAYHYGLNPETARIIMNANFAIIYDTTNEEVIVGDILYNTSFNNQGQQVDITDKVAMQIRMAIEQIAVKGKKFNISHLSQEQLEMYNKAMNLETEIDEERGLSHGAR